MKSTLRCHAHISKPGPKNGDKSSPIHSALNCVCLGSEFNGGAHGTSPASALPTGMMTHVIGDAVN